jgi:UDP-N-acetylbacillosamine N-acetyltransferase
MNSHVYLLGAGGHTRSLINLVEQNKLVISGIYDDNYKESEDEKIRGYSVIGRFNDLPKQGRIILSIGNNFQRQALFQSYYDRLYKENLIHPFSIIEPKSILGCSNQVFARAYINSVVKIGDNNIINTGAIVEHEVTIGSHNHISVGAIVCGRVKIGSGCFIGAGAVIIDKLSICDNVTIGANSVVIHNISERGTYIGNPTRKIK